MTLFLINGVPCIESENRFQAIAQTLVIEMMEHNEIHEVITINHD